MRFAAASGPAGHPLHAFVVPLPVGAFVSSLIFDILTWTRPGELPWLVDGAWWLIGVGLIGAGLASVFGVVDLLQIQRRTRPWRLALTHSALNLGAAALFLIGYVWRAGDHVEPAWAGRTIEGTHWGPRHQECADSHNRAVWESLTLLPQAPTRG
jgi:uncharacterized membrane protein